MSAPANENEGTRSAKTGRIPIAPVLGSGSLQLWSRASLPSLLDAGSHGFALTTSGRAALSLALRQIGVAQGDEVLLPAYHCVAMLGPVKALGATPVFFPHTPDLSSDLRELQRLLSVRTRALVIVHYFGFLQHLAELRELCDRHGIALIEDCAHAYYGAADDLAVGRTGDFAIGSLMKFFPMYDGGCLVSYRHQLRHATMRSRGVTFSLKAGLNIAERAAAFSSSTAKRAIVAALSKSRGMVVRAATAAGADPQQHGLRAAEGGFDFEESWVNCRISGPSRFVWRFANHERAIARRREHYRKLLDALTGIGPAKPLHPSLPPAAAPYVFPLVLADPDRSFEQLWAQGVPMYRWENVAREACPVAKTYERTLVQLPCHQELSDAQIEWLAATARRVLLGTANRTSANLVTAQCPI